MNVTSAPSAGAAVLALTASSRSGWTGATVAASWSSSAGASLPGAESPSGSFWLATWAESVPGAGPVTTAVIVAVAVAPTASAPKVSVPVAAS